MRTQPLEFEGSLRERRLKETMNPQTARNLVDQAIIVLLAGKATKAHDWRLPVACSIMCLSFVPTTQEQAEEVRVILEARAEAERKKSSGRGWFNSPKRRRY